MVLMINKMKKEKKIVGFTCGTFDITHTGHILMFQECKKVCDYLIVGLQTDPSIDRPFKNSPVQTVEERKIMLSAIKYIDEIFVYTTEADLLKFLKKKRIDIRILGADHKDYPFTGDKLPIKTYFNKRDHPYSSSSLRERIYQAEVEKIYGQN